MIRRGIRRFDLYDFFSVFLPGATLLVGLLPFLPAKTTVGTGIVLSIVVLGFVLGRAVHASAIILDDYLGNESHREAFVDELHSPELLSENLVDSFYRICCIVYTDLQMCESRAASVRSDEEIEPLYTLVRSYVHMDSRGRSRTFQAVYAFYRSMWLVSLVLAGIYFSYALFDATAISVGVEYETYLRSLGIPLVVLLGVPTSGVLFAYRVFRSSKRRHRQYYVQYLVSDFVTLYEAGELIDDGDPTIESPGGERLQIQRAAD